MFKKIAEHKIQIITLTVISLVVALVLYGSLKWENHNRDYPYVIRHAGQQWRSAELPEEWADGWVSFTDDRGNKVAIRGEILVITTNNADGSYQ